MDVSDTRDTAVSKHKPLSSCILYSSWGNIINKQNEYVNYMSDSDKCYEEKTRAGTGKRKCNEV
jgi:hypothetical protein